MKTCFQKRVPIFVPAFSDCSAGFGIVLQQTEAIEQGRGQVAFDSGKDFRELTDIKLACKDTGLLMLGGGVPIRTGTEVVGAVGVGGAPGGHLDEQCAMAALELVKEQLK